MRNSCKVRTYGSFQHHYDESMATLLLVDVNPARWSQGHNIFGSRDLKAIALPVLKDVLSKAGITMSQEEAQRVEAGEFEILTLDLNFTFRLPTAKDVSDYLTAAHDVISSKTRSKPWNFQHSIYIGAQAKNDYKMIRIYDKHKEITDKLNTKDCRLSKKLTDEDKKQLIEHAKGILRFEASFRRKWLKKQNKHRGKDWFTPGACKEALEKEFRMVNLPMNVELSETDALKLPTSLGRVYDSWIAGGWDRVCERYSARSRERYRSTFLNDYKIDLKAARKNVQDSNVVPLWRFIEANAEPEIPTWAVGTPLYFQPGGSAPAA
ncbi:MAG: hypothetical protein EOP50_08990 [Sphingobacteriales bacterium]|nr:MAG: hypothetical protein EOP50_08990 [Sphingobacteriales bacterium]